MYKYYLDNTNNKFVLGRCPGTVENRLTACFLFWMTQT